jgi:hypothetical protein
MINAQKNVRQIMGWSFLAKMEGMAKAALFERVSAFNVP